MTCDRWHMTCDTWHTTHSLRWTFSQNFSSLALPVWDWVCLEDILTKGWFIQWINELMTKVIVEQPQLHQILRLGLIYLYQIYEMFPVNLKWYKGVFYYDGMIFFINLQWRTYRYKCSNCVNSFDKQWVNCWLNTLPKLCCLSC